MDNQIILPGNSKRIMTKCKFCANPGIHSDTSGVKLCSNCARKALMVKLAKVESHKFQLMDMIGNGLVCFGCCWAEADGKFPGKPSEGRPCCFCIRNPEKDIYKKPGMPDCWCDESKPVRLPMDCYQSLDMFDQVEVWCNSKGKE